MNKELNTIIDLIYTPMDFKISQLSKETESEEYGAYSFYLNQLSIRFRVAKTTPTKVGQFVTLWKRIGNGPIQPYDMNDPVDIFVICTRKDDNHFGQFIFPKSILLEQNIMSTNNKGGKRAIRVYPPWEKSLNKQAQKTQDWQSKYFLDISSSQSINYQLVQQLYSLALI